MVKRYATVLVTLLTIAWWMGTSGCSDEARTTGGCPSDDCLDAEDDERLRRDMAADGDAGASDADDTGSPVDLVDTADQSGADLPRGGSLVPEPSSIYLIHPGPGGLVEQVVLVHNQTDRNVLFQSVEVLSAASGFSLQDAPENALRLPGQSIGFTLSFQAPDDLDTLAEIAVHHDLEAQPLVIPVTVAHKATGNACISVSPDRLDFGTVVRGDPSVTRDFSISNCGDAPISVLRLDRGRILGFITTPDSFQWTPSSPLPIALNVGQSATVEVVYTAGRAGSESGIINVISNVEGSQSVPVRLSARAEPPPISELDVHLVLTWDANHSDVDFHFYPESSELFSCDDCYYANMSPDWGTANDIIDDPFLDYDNVTGYGPENINVDELQPGSYIIAVHYYSDVGSDGGSSDPGVSPTPANATVQVYLGGVLTRTYGPQYLDSTDWTWLVARLEWPAGTLTDLANLFEVNRSDYDWCFGF